MVQNSPRNMVRNTLPAINVPEAHTHPHPAIHTLDPNICNIRASSAKQPTPIPVINIPVWLIKNPDR